MHVHSITWPQYSTTMHPQGGVGQDHVCIILPQNWAVAVNLMYVLLSNTGFSRIKSKYSTVFDLNL